MKTNIKDEILDLVLSAGYTDGDMEDIQKGIPNLFFKFIEWKDKIIGNPNKKDCIFIGKNILHLNNFVIIGLEIYIKVKIMQRTIAPKKKSFRRELECYVIGWNSVLRESVKSMSIVTLLRNAHPSYRQPFANQCVEFGMLSKHALQEFQP